MERSMTCICCPIGCTLKITGTAEFDLVVSGNRCPRGEVYAREEIFAPKRTVTAVARTDSDAFPCIPVKTDQPVAKQEIPGILKAIYKTRVPLPAKSGQIIIENFDGTGVNVVATRSMSN
jgi:CxxC motif-containing protein